MPTINPLASRFEQEIRTLMTDEIEAVSGGIINGCIRLPNILKIQLPQPPQPYVDVFAPKLPGWVHPL